MKIALQLYTIRDCIKNKESLFEALKIVKEAGYQGVEFAGFFDAPANELLQKLEELSLTPVCCHVSIDILKDIEPTLVYLKKIGCKAMALAWSETATMFQLDETCALLKAAKIKAKAEGIELYYHNHDHEFKAIDNVVPIDKIMDCCALELDSFWSFAAGHDSAQYIRDNKAKIGLLHIKDGEKLSKYPCALGEGENDIKAIVSVAKELGYEWLIIENDYPKPDGLSDVKRSIAYYNTIA